MTEPEGEQQRRRSEEEHLSTREVGRLLGVSEATVKRWADDGLIPCIRTPGGHRKFLLKDVTSFQGRNGGSFASVAGLSRGPAGIEELIELGLAGNAAAIARTLIGALGKGESLPSLCEEWLGPAIAVVGERWHSGAIHTAREHVFSNAFSEAMTQVAQVFPIEGLRGTAITCCPEGERHELAIRMVGLVLRGCGFRVLHCGANTPVVPLETLAEEEGATLIALSASGFASSFLVKPALEHLAVWAGSRGVRVLVGGTAFKNMPELPPGIELAASLRDLRRLVGDPSLPPR